MKIIEQSVEILTNIDTHILEFLEKCGRTCYKSEDKITSDSAKSFINKIMKNGHESIIEHYNITVRFICDRGISHEIVRHRIASYSQESTRYCNYGNTKFGNEITVIKPNCFKNSNINDDINYRSWELECENIERVYMSMINDGIAPQDARSILPNCLKTEVIMTTNLREWRHFIKMRGASGAHPQIRELSYQLLKQFKEKIPIIFDDLEVKI